MKSHDTGRRSRRPLRRIVAGGAILALLVTLTGALLSSASATHPKVTGKVDCVNGAWVITWTVGGDTAYPNATATIKSQSLATNPTLVGKAVKNTQTTSGTQTGAIAASTTYTQTVKVQFDTHSPGSLVTQSGSVTTGKDCAEEEKVTICHRTASYSNPYVVITVARSAVDGVAGNSGNQPDHYGEHRGPIFYPTIPKHTEWGDIIPPVSGAHNGYNWTAEGQAVYKNGCVIPDKKVPVPEKPGMNDPCGPNNATWVKPTDSDSVRWVLEPDGDLVAYTKPGYVFEDGTTSKNYGKAVDSNKPCPSTVVQPPTIPVVDECGPGNAHYGSVPAGPWTSVINPDGSVTVTANPGNTFPNGPSVTFPVPTDSNKPCPTPTPTPTPTPVPTPVPVPTPTPTPVPTPTPTPEPTTKNKGQVIGSCVTPTRGEGVAKGKVTNAHSTRVTIKQNGKVVKTRVVAPGERFRMEMHKLQVGSFVKLYMGGKQVDRDFVEDNCKKPITPHVGLRTAATKA